MKKQIGLMLGALAFCGTVFSQNVGINYNGAPPNASSALDINVSALEGQKKGLLIPRVTEAQRLAMNPLPAAFAKGLLVFQTDGQTGFYYNENDGFQPLWIFLPGTNNFRWDLLKGATNPLILQNGSNYTNITFDGVTSQDAFSLSSNSLTNGTLLNLFSNSTNGASGFSSLLLDANKLGANANNNHVSIGIRSLVSNTGINSTNYAGYFQSSGGTNNYAMVVPANGGRVSIGSTTSAHDAILSISNGHFQSVQSTEPTIVANANAGILASGSVFANSSDMAGTFSITGGGGNVFSAGAQATITFAVPYVKTPRVILTPVNVNAAGKDYYVSGGLVSFTVYFTTPPTAGTSYVFNYIAIEN
jgi:hypothetical protein